MTDINDLAALAERVKQFNIDAEEFSRDGAAMCAERDRIIMSALQGWGMKKRKCEAGLAKIAYKVVFPKITTTVELQGELSQADEQLAGFDQSGNIQPVNYGKAT